MDASSSERALFFRVGTSVAAIAVASVVETMRPLPIAPFAGTPSFVLGVAIVRGVPTPVVDASALLSVAGSSDFGRFVAIRVEERSIVLAVDEVLGVRALDGLEPSLPPLLRNASEGVVEAMSRLDSTLLVVLRAARIVPAATWDAMRRGAAS